VKRPTVLVAYATVSGSTAEIAQWVAEEIQGAGLDVQVRAARDVQDVTGYTAVVLGAAVYADGWHSDARQFAHRFAGALAQQPVWLFSSGPLDWSADETQIPAVPHAAAAMHALGAREHVTFGGRLTEQARGWLGLVLRKMASNGHSGDFRNPQRVQAWARGVAIAIKAANRGT
jgi:menaquinone-dependent protoporphyrinogen oxidase